MQREDGVLSLRFYLSAEVSKDLLYLTVDPVRTIIYQENVWNLCEEALLWIHFPLGTWLFSTHTLPFPSLNTYHLNSFTLWRYNPFGYALTDLGRQYLTFQGSTDSDVGRFLSTLKSGRKKETTIKEQWLEIVRISKQGQSMRVYRTLDDMIKFCLSAGFIDWCRLMCRRIHTYTKNE